MQHMLYIGEWNDYSCASRPWVMFWFGPVVAAFIFVLFLLRIPELLKRPKDLKIMAAVILLLGLIFGSAPALSRTTSRAYLEGGELIRTACVRGRAYEERVQQDMVVKKFKLIGKEKAPVLAVHWPKQSFELTINLRNNPFLPNLEEFAPQQMAEYVKDLQNKNDRIPFELRDLASPSTTN